MKTILEAPGYEITLVSNGHEALAQIAGATTWYCLISACQNMMG